ncbi:hypothetical protein C8J57DRAFT_1246866 [Mycena rebaudengoi]|nr:hypothetical protein C8J57DRAFT_1246866 [Mycena rebaudengoi]
MVKEREAVFGIDGHHCFAKEIDGYAIDASDGTIDALSSSTTTPPSAQIVVIYSHHNCYNHLDKGGKNNSINRPMAIVNVQRMLDYIHVTTEYIVAARPAHAGIIGVDQLSVPPQPYLHLLPTTSKHPTRIAVIGKGPYINIYNGFDTVTSWAGVLTGSGRISPRLGLAKLFRSAHFPPNAAHPSRPRGTAHSSTACPPWPGLPAVFAPPLNAGQGVCDGKDGRNAGLVLLGEF